MNERTADPIEVLLIEDSDADAELITHALAKAGLSSAVRRVETETAFLDALGPSVDIILADFEVPSFGAVRALELLRNRQSHVPLIVVSGSIGEETAIRMLQSGAADYLLKDRLARLGQAVTRAIDERIRRQEKRAVEDALKAAEARMRFALEAARVGVWETDLRSGVLVWSEILEALHGLPRGSFRGTEDAFLACVHGGDVQQVRATLASAARRGGDANLLYRVVWPDGSVRWLAGLGRTFYDETGLPVRSAGIGWDVTERRALEEQYRHSQKMEAVGVLAGGVAHDFNNLLTVIQGFSSLALEGLSPESSQHGDLLEIKGAAHRAAALTRQLLAFSRKQQVEPRVFEITDVLASLEPMIRRLVRADVEVVFSGNPQGRIRADPGQVEQVVLNLVINALDAMPTGGTLSIGVAEAEFVDPEAVQRADFTPARYLSLTVTDTGTGMDEATRARIFEPFFTTKPKGEGTGLGLATVYGIVKQSGGHIWADSEIGRGSTFKVHFPRVDEPAEVDRAAADAVPVRGTEAILVVEDEDSLRSLIERVLNSAGYESLMASTAEEAIALAKSFPRSIDLLLTDVIMPQMTGPALAEQIVAVRPDVRVLCMSGYIDNALVQRAGLGSDVPFVQKPFAPDVLIRKIREVLDSPHSVNDAFRGA